MNILDQIGQKAEHEPTTTTNTPVTKLSDRIGEVEELSESNLKNEQSADEIFDGTVLCL